MNLVEIPIIDAPFQRLQTVLNDRPVEITLSWSEWAARWSMGLALSGEIVFQGRRLVPGTDLLQGYGLSLGRLFLVDWAGLGGDPDRAALPAGDFRLIQASA